MHKVFYKCPLKLKIWQNIIALLGSCGNRVFKVTNFDTQILQIVITNLSNFKRLS